MLKAKLDSVRKNKKGFSLVELIIVIAIMVALIAVMAPAFVKYVQKSRNSALTTAAESFYSAAQTYYGDPDITPNGGNLTITIEAPGKTDDWATGAIKITSNSKVNAEMESDAKAIYDLAGVDASKAMGKATIKYTITITEGAANEGYSFAMSSEDIA